MKNASFHSVTMECAAPVMCKAWGDVTTACMPLALNLTGMGRPHCSLTKSKGVPSDQQGPRTSAAVRPRAARVRSRPTARCSAARPPSIELAVDRLSSQLSPTILGRAWWPRAPSKMHAQRLRTFAAFIRRKHTGTSNRNTRMQFQGKNRT